MRPKCSADQIIEDLYAGTLDSSAWDRALVSLADWIGSSGALLFSVNPTTEVILRDEIHRLDSDDLTAYRQHWITQDIRLAPALQLPIAEPMFERKLGIEAKWKRSAIFNEYAVPRDMPYFLATWLHKAPDKVVALSFQASCLRGPFDESDARQIKFFMGSAHETEIYARLAARCAIPGPAQCGAASFAPAA